MAYCEDPIRLQFLLNNLLEVQALSIGRSRNDLEADRRWGEALARLLEKIGAQAAGVSDDYRATYTSIPWAQLISLGNILSRGYEAVDREALWKIVSRDLPGLVPELESLILRLSAS